MNNNLNATIDSLKAVFTEMLSCQESTDSDGNCRLSDALSFVSLLVQAVEDDDIQPISSISLIAAGLEIDGGFDRSNGSHQILRAIYKGRFMFTSYARLY